MKFSFALPALLVSYVAASGSNKSAFTPVRVHYDDVLNEHFSLLDALEDSSGIISMTNLPQNFAKVKKEVMGSLHSCLLDQQEGGSIVGEESFGDGTVRRSFATATTAEEGPLRLELEDTLTPSTACQAFEGNLQLFRSIAMKATNKFTAALSQEMEPHLMKPLLTKKGDNNSSYDTIQDLVENGEQLEHFHSYQKIERISEEYHDDDHEEAMETIDVHADQGFFIAFTPGIMISHGKKDGEASASDGFYIVEEDSNGAPIRVEFDVETDDLVFMLGDGVNQYINNRLIDGENIHRRHLRATPHAVSLKLHDPSQARVWYGRMVLPPNDALVAAETVQTTLTYGDVRRRLVETPDAYIPAGLGCSSPNMRALQHSSNHNEPSACEKGTLFCWARCMGLSDYEITEEMCEEQNLGLKCINPRGQFQTGERHGDFWPACSNTTQEVTPYPVIAQKNEVICTNATWDAFVADTDGITYDHSFDLTTEKNSGTILQWSVVDEEQGIVNGRLVFNDVFGWLALGFADPDGKHNGMNGGNILMALPGTNYTPQFGLEVPGLTSAGSDEISIEIAKQKSALLATKTDPEGSIVSEYKISPHGSAFRHWSEPTGINTAQNSMEVHTNECATSMTFEVVSINGQKFNMDGMDSMIWAGNSNDYHVGYHGRANRARFNVNWKTGEAEFWTDKEDEKVAPAEDDHGDDHKHKDHGNDHDHDHDHMEDTEMDDSGVGRLSGYFTFFVAAVVPFLF